MTQNFEPKSLTILDPRTFDGDPFTVAQRAAEQANALIELAAEQAVLAAVMHRNSYMEAILQAGDELSPDGWDKSAYARKWTEIDTRLKGASQIAQMLARAAGYDPKHPPKVDA